MTGNRCPMVISTSHVTRSGRKRTFHLRFSTPQLIGNTTDAIGRAYSMFGKNIHNVPLVTVTTQACMAMAMTISSV
jgi:hypothetical protein